MYSYKNLEKALNINITIKKGTYNIYESPLLNYKTQFDYESGLYTIITSSSITSDVLELIKIVIKNNEQVQPFWIRVLKELPIDVSEIPKPYVKDREMAIWLIKGQQIKEDIELIEAMFDESHVFSISQETIIVVYLASDDVLPEDLLAHVEVEVMKNVKLIIGANVTKVVDLRLSYEKALMINNLTLGKDQAIIAFEDVLLESIIGSLSIDDKRNLFESYSTIYPIFGLNAELKETIYGFFKHNLNITDTANDLYLHRNTLIYRLNKILQVTKLDIRNFEEACKMKILLLLD